MGKKLKPVPEGNKGLGKLPTEVRNKMGFMKKGGRVIGKNISDADRARVQDMMGKEKLDPEVSGLLSQMSLKESGKSISDADRARLNETVGKMRKPRGMKKGGMVKGGTSSQMTGKEFKGIF